MKNKKMNNKGITLIALIITIIVMLILVGVTVNVALNGGIFENAKQARKDTEKNAILEELIEMATWTQGGKIKIDDLRSAVEAKYAGSNLTYNQENGKLTITGKYGTYDYKLTPEEINIWEAEGAGGDNPSPSGEVDISQLPEIQAGVLATEKSKYTSGADIAVIPKGFTVSNVSGVPGEQTISTGLVVRDSEGNEFVWIPVSYTETKTDNDSNGYDDGFDETFKRSNTNDTNYKEPLTSGGYNEEEQEYNDMKESVYKNGGFYIGRYEAGSTTSRTDSANGTTEMVVKRDQYPYNYVGWGASISDYESDVTFHSKNQGKGALYLCKDMYNGEDVGVNSTLCYGVTWDAMLNFIEDEKDINDSTSWGNYSNNAWTIDREEAKYYNEGSWKQISEELNKEKSKTSSESLLLTTGASDNFVAKNIYDVAGNVAELTNEANDTRYRVNRLCFYSSHGSYFPASRRLYTDPNTCNDYFGFRPVLYIK